MNKAALGFVVVMLLAIMGYYALNRGQTASPTTVTPTMSPDISPSPSDLGQGGSSYMDPDGVFVLLYPNDYTIDTEGEDIVRFVKRGESARPQSEITNGALVVIEKADIGTMSFEEWVDARIATSTADGTAQIIEAKKETTINDQPAFTYRVRSFGESQVYIVKKEGDSTSALVVSTLVEDPQNVGYQQEVDAMLATLEVLK